MARKSITYEEIQKIKPFELTKMTKQELVDLGKRILPKTRTRLNQIENAKGIYSPAAENVKAGMSNKSYSKMTKNQLIHDISLQIQFHKAKTSTVKGTREWQRTQDIYIFGKGESGLPKHTLNPTQRKNFWSLYREFNAQYKNARYLIGYDKIQQFLGDMVAQDKSIVNYNEINPATLEELMRRVKEEYFEENEDYEYDDDDVFSV